MAITNKVKVLSAAALSIVFSAIAIAVANGKTAAFDLEWSKAIYSLRTPALTQFLAAISSVSSTPFTGLLTAIVIAAFWIKNKRKTAFFFGSTLLASVIANNLIKYTFQRHRPELPNMTALEDASWFSFPSGHSMNSLVFYWALLYIAHRSTGNKRRLAILDIAVILFVTLVGFSRIYLGAHYPTDVIAGFCAGGCVLLVAAAIEKTGRFRKFFSAEG